MNLNRMNCEFPFSNVKHYECLVWAALCVLASSIVVWKILFGRAQPLYTANIQPGKDDINNLAL